MPSTFASASWGVPTATCTNNSGTVAFIAIQGSNEIVQVDLVHGRLLGPINLSRPGGAKGVRDASRGEDVHDLVGVRWAANPDRLVALGYDGYILIIAELQPAL